MRSANSRSLDCPEVVVITGVHRCRQVYLNAANSWKAKRM